MFKKSDKNKCPSSGCVQKVGDWWRVYSGVTGKIWPAKYNTEEEADNALKLYHGWGFGKKAKYKVASELIKIAKQLIAYMSEKKYYTVRDNMVGVVWDYDIIITGFITQNEFNSAINRFSNIYYNEARRIARKMSDLGFENISWNVGVPLIIPNKDVITLNQSMNWSIPKDKDLEIMRDYLERVMKIKRS